MCSLFLLFSSFVCVVLESVLFSFLSVYVVLLCLYIYWHVSYVSVILVYFLYIVHTIEYGQYNNVICFFNNTFSSFYTNNFGFLRCGV